MDLHHWGKGSQKGRFLTTSHINHDKVDNLKRGETVKLVIYCHVNSGSLRFYTPDLEILDRI